jgi:hypothetical protein
MNGSIRKITLGTTYYNCPDLLNDFVKTNLPYVDELIIVDDGSVEPASNYLRPDDKLKLFVVNNDLGFNSHGCRNLIVDQATNDWIVLIDIDRQFKDPEYTFNSLQLKKLYKDVRYLFVVHAPVWEKGMHYSVNDYLIHKDLFARAGGYDEEIVGQRWGDREFFKQLLSAGGKEIVLSDIDLVHMRPSTLKLNDKKLISSCNEVTHRELINERIKIPDPNKPTLQFRWYQVT